MMYLSDSSSPEQESRAQEVRLILERTLALAQDRGSLERTKDGFWQYVGNEHTLIYNPESDSLWMTANAGSWQLGYHEQAFLSGNSSQITDQQLEEFRELNAFLDDQAVPETVDLRSFTSSAQQAWKLEHSLLPEAQEAISVTAARLFECYVEQGTEAYKESLNSNEWFYRVTVDDAVYLISRDDAAMTYSVQREDAQSLSRNDLQTWQDIDTWLTQPQSIRFEALADPRDGWQGTYWEQQISRANAILPIAEQLFAYQEQHGTLHLDEADQSYVSGIGNYRFGYVPATDTFWIDRPGDRGAQQRSSRLVSATNWHDYCDQNCWQLQGLEQLGNITPFDVEQMQSLQAWLQVKHPQWQPSADHDRSLIHTYRRDRSRVSDAEGSDTGPRTEAEDLQVFEFLSKDSIETPSPKPGETERG
ncbi:MAG: hypothetical protein KME12_18030 [Trichocoleus desertorum ATA4-8-CV12]|jgi:hypothetical protein|nr:hypothetical protein [Trichocoleus desertorum ATA4-8-CV12]